MTPRRRVLTARILLAAFAAGCALWLGRLDHRARIATDVLALLPADERDPGLALARSLAAERHARVALFVIEAPGADAATIARAAGAVAGRLSASGAFREALVVSDPRIREAAARLAYERRFDLALPSWLEERAREYAAAGAGEPWPEWLAGRVCERLDTFLAQPEAMAFEAVLGADPLLLLPALAERVPADRAVPGERALIWAEAAASPLSEDGQEPVFRAVDAAATTAREIAPSATLRWTAVSRFAAESRRRIEAEIKLLNTAALVAVIGVLVAALRRVRQVVHLLPVMLGSILGAWTVTNLVFEQVHVLVLVIGSLLAGVSVDYGLHIFLHRGRPGEDFGARLRGLWRPLVGGVATSLAGFIVLASSGLPLLRQTGVFVSAGIVSAVGVALAWFAQLPTVEGATRLEGRLTWRGLRRRGTRVAIVAGAVAGVLAAIAGLARVRWHDDIRELEVRAPELWTNDAAVRARFGEPSGAGVMLTRGVDAAGARAALARLEDWLAREAPGARAASIGLVLPLPDDHARAAERVHALDAWEPVLRAALERHGYEVAAFEPFFDAWRDLVARPAWPDYGTMAAGFLRELPGPVAMAADIRPGAAWFAVTIEGAPDLEPPPDTATAPLAQLATLNHLFSRYRGEALRLGVIGLLTAAASVVVIFGPRRGFVMFVLPAGACLAVFGVWGWSGHTLNLFHLLGAFLAVCLTIDYAIFAGHRAKREAGVPPSVRLSALTTVAAFAVLGFSAIPVVSALGITVASVVACGWAFVEAAALLTTGDEPDAGA